MISGGSCSFLAPRTSGQAVTFSHIYYTRLTRLRGELIVDLIAALPRLFPPRLRKTVSSYALYTCVGPAWFPSCCAR